MTTDPQSIQIEVTPRFQRDLRTLAKRYRNIRNDIQPVIEQLQAGELPGSRIPGMEYEIFKVRIKNSDIQKGKSAGYRAIYYLKTSD
ncbi:type II toxin-antitoxin system RelE/ParE family toxin [Microcoleus sp. T3_B1]